MSAKITKTASRTIDLFISNEPFKLQNGGVLAELEIAYETHGELNADKSNAILVCHALTGSAHVTWRCYVPGFYDRAYTFVTVY